MRPLPAPTATPPVQLTRFVGRERELADLGQLLSTTRLLTLTGAGGSGKTRLASELLTRQTQAEFVAWIDLAAASGAELVLPLVAHGLGAPDRADQPTLDLLVTAIGDRAPLLVLDNCEHLVDAVAGLTEALLLRAPRLTVLATSREALGVPGEVAWLVPPLAPAEAEMLFVERARAVMPSFTAGPLHHDAIVDVCHRLDGLPLAIELAAARIRVLSPGQIAERLGDALTLLGAGGRTALPRQRTLRGAIDWSHDLLTTREQLLLHRLSVFAGAFTLESAESICAAAPISGDEVLDGVAALVDKSMVVLDADASTGNARYRLLETIRQYAAERLEHSGEEPDLRARHASWHLALAESAEPRLFGGARDPELVESLAAIAPNLRAAADWFAESPGRTADLLRLGYALHWYWFARGRFTEGRHRLEAALAAAHGVDSVIRGKAMIAAGHLALWQGAIDVAAPWMESAFAILGASDDPELAAYACNAAGATRFLTGDLAGATPLLDRALDLAGAIPDHVLTAIIRYWRGLVAMEAGERSLARRLFQDARHIGHRIGHRPAMGHPLLMLGRLSLREEQWRDALESFAESLRVLHEIGDLWGTAQALEGVALAAAGRGDAPTAVQYLAVAAALRHRIASPHLPQEVDPMTTVTTWVRAELGGAFDDQWRTAGQLALEDAVELAQRVAPATGTHAAVIRSVDAGAGRHDLTVRALGPLEVLVEGEAVRPSAWTSARSRELLIFLLCHPRGVSKDQVGVAFWPEASSAQVRNAFHVTLHRLRRALGQAEWIAAGQGMYRIAPEVRVHFDVDRFERDGRDAMRAASRDEPMAAKGLESALALYRGDFLEDAQAGDWSMDVRARLQRNHTDLCLALSALQLLEGRVQAAVATSRQLLQRDPLHEEGWRRLMTAHARLGERTTALQLHQEFVTRLEADFGTTPDRVTAALHERLLAGLEV